MSSLISESKPLSNETASSTSSDSLKVSRHASNKITYKITMIAEQECKQSIEDFNQCAKGRSFSMVWACKAKYKASQDCVHQYLNDTNVNLVIKRWIDEGRPKTPDWDKLLKGIGPSTGEPRLH